MSDLSPVITRALNKLQSEIQQLNRGGSKKTPKPHKLILLLAVLDVIEAKSTFDNKIYFDERLKEFFKKNFVRFGEEDDWLQIGPPYFHLRSADFWHLQVKEGREESYGKLTTSGGGEKRIRDNIEYAYLSPYALSVVTDPLARNRLREFIISIMSQRISTVFHERLPLSRPAISAIMSVLNTDKVSKNLKSILREKTHLGNNYVKAMPHYARGCGLLDFNNQITLFGSMVLKYDPLMESLKTQWLMHYFMSAPHGPGPQFWHEFVCKKFRYGEQFSRETLVSHLADIFSDISGTELSNNSLDSTVTAFTSAYLNDDGLGRLNFLQREDDYFSFLEPDPPPVWAVAVALFDFWAAHFPNQVTIGLDKLYAEGGLTSIFMIGEGRLNRYLRTIQEAGLIDVYRVAPPYQVALYNPDMALALHNLYTSNDDTD